MRMDDLQFYKQAYEEKGDLLRAVTEVAYQLKDEVKALQEENVKLLAKCEKLDSIAERAIDLNDKLVAEGKRLAEYIKKQDKFINSIIEG